MGMALKNLASAMNNTQALITLGIEPTPIAMVIRLRRILKLSRPERMQKLKLAANSGQNPGFDFLQECWNDDLALVIMIKKLLVK